jgi:hypothetical protein
VNLSTVCFWEMYTVLSGEQLQLTGRTQGLGKAGTTASCCLYVSVQLHHIICLTDRRCSDGTKKRSRIKNVVPHKLFTSPVRRVKLDENESLLC